MRLAELVAALSLGVDLGFGQPMEHVLRQTRISMRLAETMGLAESEQSAAYHTALMVNVGCHSDAHEQAKWFGDDIALKAKKYEHELGSLAAALATMRTLGKGNPPLHRFRVGVEFAISGHHDLNGMIAQHSALGRRLAGQLGLSRAVQEAVGAAYEQWDGKGWPGELRGNAIPMASRLAQIGEFTEVAHRIGGTSAAVSLARKRAGTQFDPEVAEVFCAHADDIVSGLDDAETWAAVIGAEPSLAVHLSWSQFDEALFAIAEFVDLKSPYMLGHARGVAELVGAAAASLGLGRTESDVLRRAGVVHGLGRLGVSNAIWDKRGALGAGEWERVRMHPYLTERILSQSSTLAPLGAIAAALRERLDGSGYPRRLPGSAIPLSARVLGAADAYQAMREPRPHRSALTPREAATELRREVTAGRMAGDAVEAVLGAAGHRMTRRRTGPAGLTAREIDVLRLVSRGVATREIASQLVISPKTTRNHIEHIYTKIGVSNRAGASLFAVQHGLLPDEEPPSVAGEDGAIAPRSRQHPPLPSKKGTRRTR
ncbi:LuxR C-terminal-related transcriptional regulator [Actinomycetospora endophytica]|uniref:LuxR C-terminal-related transcriptional regulator n=1 Tax=Actinomycetospora endophytica TaxID=2291215 RepID=A0ABS8PHH1_9PSEU|nr:HD domain-containing phosphohydrolase [Actinomycetospora endophytica]MCD2197614.1 LuxR C-terminal-related transcriptional regulator [Actinomycetospora endophytica]